jgi:hypothetical protein
MHGQSYAWLVWAFALSLTVYLLYALASGRAWFPSHRFEAPARRADQPIRYWGNVVVLAGLAAWCFYLCLR